MSELRRKFIRHPIHIPIEVGYVDKLVHDKEYLNNVSLGGIAFESDSHWDIDSIIIVNILVSPPLKFNGKVVWCRHNKNSFDVGVELLTEIDCTKETSKKECQIQIYKQMLINVGSNIDDIIII